MKIFKIIFLIIAFICFTFSCSKSENKTSGPDDDLAQQQNETENKIIPISDIESGIRIAGATKKTGTPPSPNGKLDFQINTNKQEAFQEAGFDITFSSLDNIKGAYVLFQDSDGNKLDKYLEVPVSALDGKKDSENNIKTSKKHRKKSIQNRGLTGNDFEIDVDFDNIPAGTFCYEICIYDADNNISAIQNICVKVEAWGGNSEIVGEWIFDRSDDDSEENDTTEINCENGDTITVNYDSEDNEIWVLVLNANGTYYETYKGSVRYLDYETTQANCSASYNKEEDIDEKYSGNWAYNEDKKTLTIIDFKYENFLDASENETYTDGSVYFDGNNTTAKVISSELVIVDSFDEGSETFSDTYIFKRK